MCSGKGSSTGAIQESRKNVGAMDEPFLPYLTSDFEPGLDSVVYSGKCQLTQSVAEPNGSVDCLWYYL